jgi:hypothetical protein
MMISDLNLIFFLLFSFSNGFEVLFTSRDHIHLSDFTRVLDETNADIKKENTKEEKVEHPLIPEQKFKLEVSL